MVAAPGDLVTINGRGFQQEGFKPDYLRVWLVHRDGGVGSIMAEVLRGMQNLLLQVNKIVIPCIER